MIAKQGNITVTVSIDKHQTTEPCSPRSTQPVDHALLRAVRMFHVANDSSASRQLLFMPAITCVTIDSQLPVHLHFNIVSSIRFLSLDDLSPGTLS